MGKKTPLEKVCFLCFDCEATGLNTKEDHLLEIGGVITKGFEVLETFEQLMHPPIPIPQEVTAIHGITDAMCQDAPSIESVLRQLIPKLSDGVIVGHSIDFDVAMVTAACDRYHIPNKLATLPVIDTLRLSRLYGACRVNSLKALRQHFNIASACDHRALNDAQANLELFYHLTRSFRSLEEILERLKHPIEMRLMPLGRYRGRPFREVPTSDLKWCLHRGFDQDLTFSVLKELRRRKERPTFSQASNPFQGL